MIQFNEDNLLRNNSRKKLFLIIYMYHSALQVPPFWLICWNRSQLQTDQSVITSDLTLCHYTQMEKKTIGSISIFSFYIETFLCFFGMIHSVIGDHIFLFVFCFPIYSPSSMGTVQCKMNDVCIYVHYNPLVFIKRFVTLLVAVPPSTNEFTLIR